MTRRFAALWHWWRDTSSYGVFVALTALIPLLCILTGTLLGGLVGAATGDAARGFNDGAVVGAVGGGLLFFFAPTGRRARQRREALFGPVRPATPELLRSPEQGREVGTLRHRDSPLALPAALLSAGFAEDAGTVIGEVTVQVFRKSQFRLSWLATRLHVFAFAVDGAGVPTDQIPQIAESCREHAISRKPGIARGLQTGVVAMPFFTVTNASPELAEWASSPQPGRFAAILYPVIMAQDTGSVLRRTTPQRLGRIYEGYLSRTAAEVVGNARASETTS
jgi:hypothetical protein